MFDEEKRKAWRRLNASKYKEYWKEWRKKHYKEILIRNRLWYKKNKKKVHLWILRDKKKNKERDKIYNLIWVLINKDKIAIYNCKRRDRLKNGCFTEKEWKEIKEKQNYKCALCKKKKDLTIDHITPLSKNGSNVKENIQALCKSCNSSKGNKLCTQQEFIL